MSIAFYMTNFKNLFVVGVALVVGVVAGIAEEVTDFRTWTTQDGGVLEAKLLKREANTLFLEDLNGGQFKIALAALSVADQEIIAKANLPSLGSMNTIAQRMHISSLVGETLETASGAKVPSDVLAGKVLGIYVSAKACDSCAVVTSNLTSYIATLSPEFKARFQVVYVGVDTNPEDQKEFLMEHGLRWLAIPHASEAKVKLLKRFKLNEAPNLLFVRYDGTVLEKKGLRLLERNDIAALEEMIERHGR